MLCRREECDFRPVSSPRALQLPLELLTGGLPGVVDSADDWPSLLVAAMSDSLLETKHQGGSLGADPLWDSEVH